MEQGSVDMKLFLLLDVKSVVIHDFLIGQRSVLASSL